MRTISNQKYEITDMAHEEYPFLHRIRALRDICGEIRAGDIGGFVESESNLSAEPGDCAWIFDDAIAAGDAYVDRDACLRGDAIACGSAYVSKGSVMSGHSHAEDNAYLRGASMTGKALASGNAQIIHDPHTMGTPILSGNCKVYGTVQGDIATAIAPIPLASFAGQPSSSIGVAFLKSYAAICLEGCVIVLACVIFSAFASSPPAIADDTLAAATIVWNYVGELIFNMLVLVGAIKMSDRIIRELMGLG